MNAQPLPHIAPRTSQDILDAAVGAAPTGGRPDVTGRPPASRHDHEDTSVTVQVAGGTQQDRTAIAAGLLRAGSGRVTFTGDHPDGPLGAAVDAVVLVASAEQVLEAAELDRAYTLRHRAPHILLALTAIDRNPSWREALEADVARLRAAGVTVTPFAVSVDMHRQAVATDNRVLATVSGIPALARRIDDVAEQAAIDAAGTATRSARRRAARRSRPTPDGTGPARSRWQQVLADGMAAASSDVDFDLRSRVRTAVADAERVIEANDPARIWNELDTWLRDRLAYEGERTFALLADRTAEIAVALERELGGRPLPRPAPAEPPDFFGHQPPRDAPTGLRRSTAARSRSLVMSGYGGLMMALILPRFAGVALPTWMVVAGALGAALLLGGASLSGERKRRLETGRTRAKSRLRHCADDFLLVATKATRDTLRRMQQQLRDECTRVMEP